jgi:hypothetical protein
MRLSDEAMAYLLEVAEKDGATNLDALASEMILGWREDEEGAEGYWTAPAREV